MYCTLVRRGTRVVVDYVQIIFISSLFGFILAIWKRDFYTLKLGDMAWLGVEIVLPKYNGPSITLDNCISNYNHEGG